MSIVVRYAAVPSSTVEQYDEVMRRLQESGEMPADGFDYHLAFWLLIKGFNPGAYAKGFRSGLGAPRLAAGGA